MAQMTVLLPDDLQSWADARAVEGGFSSISDYICDLIRRDREDVETLAALQAAIDAGRASPEVDTSIEDIIAECKRRHALV